MYTSYLDSSDVCLQLEYINTLVSVNLVPEIWDLELMWLPLVSEPEQIKPSLRSSSHSAERDQTRSFG